MGWRRLQFVLPIVFASLVSATVVAQVAAEVPLPADR
jgi:hypothetical protein